MIKKLFQNRFSKFLPCFCKHKRKPLKLLIISNLRGFLCTQTRGRTGMEVNPLVFETSASTDSAIWANFDVCSL